MEHLTPDVIARIGAERVPRYTSYPAATSFSPAVDARQQAHWLAELPPGTGLSLYLHVPFCRAMCAYCGCHTQVTSRLERVAHYAAQLRREIVACIAHMPHRGLIEHLHWGGGTPTLLAPSDFLATMALLESSFGFAAGAERGIEIDPRNMEWPKIEMLAQAGINRASLGVQTFDPQVQRAIRREQSFEQTERVMRGLREVGIASVNVDLLYGLPHQTAANVQASTEQVLALRPDRIALFGYAHVPWLKPHQSQFATQTLPGAAERLTQADAAAAVLLTNGYVRIGLDHFARPDDALAKAQLAGDLHRNFQGYTTDRSDVLLGFGASAISSFPQGYVQNVSDVKAYGARIDAGELAGARGIELTVDDCVRRVIIERLMCDLRVDLAQVAREHAIDAAQFTRELVELDELAARGLLIRQQLSIRIPESARMLVRLVACVFDRHRVQAPLQARHVIAV